MVKIISSLIFLNWSEMHFCAVEKIRSASGVANYAVGKGPTSGLQDDYYKSENIGHEGKWYDPEGILKVFGINHGDIVNYEDLLSILEGNNPRTGQSLFDKVKEKHMPGTELDISVPKSVSAIWAVADNELKAEIDKAIMESNEYALNYVQQNSSYTRTGKGGSEHVQAPFAAAIFAHGSSRGATNLAGGDPHRHFHNLLLNFTSHLGKSMTLENSYLHRDQKAIGAQARAHLAIKLRSLGFEIERTPDGAFKIPGVPEELVKLWSSRRQEMLAAAAANNVSINDRKGMQQLQQATRRSKIVKHINDLISRWKSEAYEFKFTSEIVKSLTQSKTVDPNSEELNKIIENAAKASVDELISTDSVFTKTQLIQKLSENLAGIIGAEKILNEVNNLMRMENIVFMNESNPTTTVYMSTKEQVALEQSIPPRAKKLFTDGAHGINESIVEYVITKKTGMSEEQADAVRHATSAGSLKVIVGDAGVGKTYSSEPINEILQSAGYTVHTIAPTWKAVKGLEDELDVNGTSISIHGLISKVQKGSIKMDSKSAIIIDEAGMLGSKMTSSLMEISEKTGCKLVLMGDHKQLNATEAGAGMQIILNNTEHARIATIRRQSEAWARDMVADLASGKTVSALEALFEHNDVKFAKSDDHLLKNLIDDWAKSTEELGWTPATATQSDRSHLIIAVRNDDVYTLNNMVRSILHERKLLGEDVEVKCQPISAKSNPEFMNFSVGDRIILRKNDQKNLEVSNRDEGLITRIEHSVDGGYDFTLKMNNGETKIINTKKYIDEETKSFAATHGYAYSVYSSQGMTNKRVFAVADGMAQRYAYVGLSRHKESVKLYVNEQSLRMKVASREQILPRFVTQKDIKQQLVTQMARKTEKLSTLDFEIDVSKNKLSKAQVSIDKFRSTLNTIEKKASSSIELLKTAALKISEKLSFVSKQKVEKPTLKMLQNIRDNAVKSKVMSNKGLSK